MARAYSKRFLALALVLGVLFVTGILPVPWRTVAKKRSYDYVNTLIGTVGGGRLECSLPYVGSYTDKAV